MSRYIERSHWLFSFTFALSSFESFVAFIWLTRIPTDPKNAILGPYSAWRLVALGGFFITGTLFGFLMILAMRRSITKAWLIKARHYHPLPIILFNFLGMGLLFSLFFLILPPKNLIPPGSALAKRLAPLLIWSPLICAQGISLILRFFQQAIRTWFDRFVCVIRRWARSPLTWYTLLGLSALISSTQVFYVYYNLGDEGDTLAVGWLMSRGWILYKDIFSHHFPLSYLWAALVVRIFGASILAVRLSIVLLRTLVFAFVMKVSRYSFSLGLTALAWSLLGHLYLGNSLLYYSFSGLFSVAAFAMGLAIVDGQKPATRTALGIVGIFLALAVLSDPLKILTAGVTVPVIFFSGLSKSSIIEGLKRGTFRAGWVVGGLWFVFAIFMIWLLINGNGLEFYQDAIVFNLEIYSKYSPVITTKTVVDPVVNLLDLGNEQWHRYVSPYYDWESFEFIDHWIFTGFFYRLSIVVASMVLLTRGKIVSSVYVYLFGAMMLVRGSTYLYSSPFVLLSLGVSSLLLSGSLSSSNSPPDGQGIHHRKGLWKNTVAVLRKLMRLVIFLMFIWLNVRGAAFLINNRWDMTYARNFGAIEGDAGRIREATCGHPKARLLVYPLEPIQYFLSQTTPASKYHFMTPWVAETGQTQVITDLKEEPVLVLVARDFLVWGHPVAQYLSDLLGYLDHNYILIEEGWYDVYRSPTLEEFCQENQ